MAEETFRGVVDELCKAVSLCSDNALVTPGLMLLYSSIDIFGWLEFGDIPSGKRFQQWSEKYLVPFAGLPCTSSELWGARCGLLHSHRIESKAPVRHLAYSWGYAKPDVLADALQIFDHKDVVAVAAERLVREHRNAANRFVNSVVTDVKLGQSVYPRAATMLISTKESKTARRLVEKAVKLYRSKGKGR